MAQNLPKEFLQRMEEMLGREYPAFLSSYQEPCAQGLRLNRLKGREEAKEACERAFHLTPVPWSEDGFYYQEGDRPGKHPFHEAGLYYIQEPSAMAAAELLGPEPGDYVLDLCAAPGGKSSHIASLLGGRGFLLSNEIHGARARILSQNMERMGIANGAVTSHDSKSLARWFPEYFDKIMVDAPCSGEGMFRKDEAARGEWSPAGVKACAIRQQEILEHAALMLKPGGKLLYSTCTFSPEEDEGSVAAFLDAHQEFSIQASSFYDGFHRGNPQWLPGGGGREALRQTWRIWPHKVRGEGHYLALLTKAEGGAGSAEEAFGREKSGISAGEETFGREKVRISAGEEAFGRERAGILAGEEAFGREKARISAGEEAFGRERAGVSGGGARNQIKDKARRECFLSFCQELFPAAPGQKTPELAWEQMPGYYRMFGENLYYVHEGLPQGEGMRILRPGLHLGVFKPKRFEPSHALALYLKPSQVRRSYSLQAEGGEAKRYLRGETLEASGREGGWTLVDVEGFSLGWAKQAQGVLKNHYPKGLRWC